MSGQGAELLGLPLLNLRNPLNLVRGKPGDPSHKPRVNVTR